MKRALIFTLFAILSLSGAALVGAQDVLNYGTTLSDTLAADAPQKFYSFSGTTGDVVTAYALGWEEAFQPTISLLSSSGQPLEFSAEDPLTPFENDVRVTTRLPADGTYSVIVSGENGSVGTYTLTLRLTQPAISTALTDQVVINIPPGAPPQLYSVTASPDASTPLNIQSNTPGFEFRVQLNNPDGNVLTVVTGGVESINVFIPAGVGVYELLISSSDPAAGGDLIIQRTGELAVTDTGASTASPPTAAPQVTDGCVITASGVNVRSGPGTNFAAIGSLGTGDQFIATGQNSGWYTGTYNGQQAWVASGVVTVSGEACNTLPVVDAPSGDAPPPVTTQEATDEMTEAPPTEETEVPTEATDAPTEETEVAETQEATDEATVEATEATELPPTEEVVETTAQIAEPDNNHSTEYNIKGQGQTISGSISYPDGDTSDVVSYTLTGYDSVTQRAEIRWTLFCNGDTENVELLFGGQSVGGCNTSFTRAINAGNGNGGGTARASVTVQYTGGTAAYLDWQLQAVTQSCAPRDC